MFEATRGAQRSPADHTNSKRKNGILHGAPGEDEEQGGTYGAQKGLC